MVVPIHIPEVTNSRYLLRDARVRARIDHIAELENPIAAIALLESREIPFSDSEEKTPITRICIFTCDIFYTSANKKRSMSIKLLYKGEMESIKIFERSVNMFCVVLVDAINQKAKIELNKLWEVSDRNLFRKFYFHIYFDFIQTYKQTRI